MAQNPYQKARYNAQRRIQRAIEKGYQIPEEMRYIPSYSELKSLGFTEGAISALTEQLKAQRLYEFDEIGKVFRSDTGEAIFTPQQEETIDRERYRDLFGSSGYDSTDSYYEDLEEAKERYRAEEKAKYENLFDQVDALLEAFDKESSWLISGSGGRGNGYFVDWRNDKSTLREIWRDTRSEAEYSETEKHLFDYITVNIENISTEVNKLIESRYADEYKGAVANLANILNFGISLSPEQAENLAIDLDAINGW